VGQPVKSRGDFSDEITSLLNSSLLKNINCDICFSGKVSGQDRKTQMSSKNSNVAVALKNSALGFNGKEYGPEPRGHISFKFEERKRQNCLGECIHRLPLKTIVFK
jgi:hypothetical protein